MTTDETGRPTFRCTSVYAPGVSSPLRLSTSTSTSSVREFTSMDFAVRTSVPSNERPRILGKCELRLCARQRIARVNLRHVDVDTQHVRRGHVEELFGCALVDELTDIDAARGDDAIEGRIDLLERLNCFQPLHVGDLRLHQRVGRLRLGGEVLRVLARHRVLPQQALIALRRALGIAGVGLRRGQVCSCLQQLLIDFRRADDRQQLPFANMRADIEVPMAEITVGARIDRRVFIGIDIAGRTISELGEPLLGLESSTSGAASAFVSCSQRSACVLPMEMPTTAMTAATITSSTSTMTAVRPETRDCGAGAPSCSLCVCVAGLRVVVQARSWSSKCSVIVACGSVAIPARAGAAAALQRAMHNAEECGNEEERGHGGKDQSADDGAAQRRVLLAAFAQPKRHRHHADDHGQRGHQHRAEAREAGGQSGGYGIAVIDLQLLLGER